MYLPRAFAIADLAELHGFMEQHNFATLVTHHSGEMIASHVPLVVDRQSGKFGRVRGHLAARNPQLAHFAAGVEALVIFQGDHRYISPSWYASAGNVPTWNYTAVHAYGRAQLLDRTGMVALLKDLVHQHEKPFDQPWDFDAEAQWIEKMLAHISGFAIEIEKLEGKYKLNQNRTPADRDRVVEILGASEDPSARRMAELIQQWRPDRER